MLTGTFSRSLNKHHFPYICFVVSLKNKLKCENFWTDCERKTDATWPNVAFPKTFFTQNSPALSSYHFHSQSILLVILTSPYHPTNNYDFTIHHIIFTTPVTMNKHQPYTLRDILTNSEIIIIIIIAYTNDMSWLVK